MDAVVSSGQPTDVSQALRRLSTPVKLLPVAYLSLLAFPGAYMAAGSGLDPSWVYGLNALALSGHIFGRDVAFTYGPLGYILDPLDMGTNLLQGLAFRFLIHLVFVLTLAHFALKPRRWIQVWLFTAAYVAAMLAGLGYEPQIVVALLLCVVMDGGPLSPLAGGLAGAVTGTFLFMKFSLGVETLAMIVLAGVACLYNRDRRRLPGVLSAASAFLCSVAVVATVLLKSPANAASWFHESVEIAGAYSSAMSITGHPDFLSYGLESLAMYGILCVALLTVRSSQAPLAIAFAPMTFFSFKEGFVRQDVGHVLGFFPVVIFLVGLLILTSTEWKELAFATSTCVAVLWATSTVVGGLQGVRLPSVADVTNAAQGRSNLAHLLDLQNVRANLARQSRSNLQPDRLPDRWSNVLHHTGSAVGILPWELSFAAANGLDWSPNPVLQAYSAYTPFLDKWSAAHYEGSKAPHYIIAQFLDVDGRNPLLSEPDTWRSVLANYRVRDSDPKLGALLLEKVPEPSAVSMKRIGQTTATIGERITVPHSGRLVYAKFEMRQTLIGKVQSALVQAPPVYLGLLYGSGRTITYRFIPATAEDAVPISYVPWDIEGFKQLFSGSAVDPVVAFEIYGPGAALYESKFRLIWLESDRRLSYPTSSTEGAHGLNPAGNNSPFSVDNFNKYRQPRSGSVLRVDMETDPNIRITGWAVDGDAGRAASQVWIDIDGRTELPAAYGASRPDVAAHFHNQLFGPSGFSAAFGTWILGRRGLHVLSLRVVTADGRSYYDPGYRLYVDVQ